MMDGRVIVLGVGAIILLLAAVGGTVVITGWFVGRMGVAPFIRWRTTDDRGAPCRLTADLRNEVRGVSREVEQAAADAGVPSRFTEAMLLYVLVPLLGMVVVCSGAPPVLPFAVVVLGVIALQLWLSRARAVVRAEVATRYGRCGACGYPLQTPPASDGCTVCPECGAAWRTRGPVADSIQSSVEDVGGEVT